MSTHKIYAKVMRGDRPPFPDPQPPDGLQALVQTMWSQVPWIRSNSEIPILFFFHSLSAVVTLMGTFLFKIVIPAPHS
jgi:hypothetical protein